MDSRFERQLKRGALEMLVLSLVCEKPAHGYELLSEIAQRSGGALTLKEGTLYPILHALEKEGRVKSFRREAENGRERKYYRITPTGLALLQDKAEEWRLFSEKVNAVVQGCTPVGA